MNRQLRADMMLVLVTLFWGVSYLLMDTALEDLEPFTLNFIRFFGAFVIAIICTRGWDYLISIFKRFYKGGDKEKWHE